MAKLFGTDGIRGIANSELTCELALKVGKAVAQVLAGSYDHTPKILIGKDTRISSDMIECALLSGICSVGAAGISLGIVPTPAVAYLVKKYGADAGIMISASHNSYEFNGIKIFDKNGYKLSDSIEEQIETIILDSSYSFPLLAGKSIGKIIHNDNAARDYINNIKSAVSIPKNKNFKIAVDCANGSTSATAEILFKELGLNVNIIFDKPNGFNINENCGSTSLGCLSNFVIKNNCNLGIAFDGDADRCLFVDEEGKIIDGDSILGICADFMKKEGALKNNTLVGTIMSNFGLKKFCEKNNINFCETKVGDKYVLEKMLEGGYNIGGEQSGHVIFLDFSTTGDGQLTAVQLLSVLLKSKVKASELASIIKKYPQKSITIEIQSNQKGVIAKDKNVNKQIEVIQRELENKGKIVVRESGTEPKIRIMVECEDKNKLNEIIENACKIVNESLNLRKVKTK